MAEVWPALLQQKINTAGFGLAFGNTLIRSDMDVGLAKVRSRFTDGIDVYTTTIDLDIEEHAVLSTFYKTTLNNGTITFLFYNPMEEATEEFRFIEPPSYAPLGSGGRNFRVSMRWERIP